jgi:hypothetical protein
MPAHMHPTSALYGLGYTPDYVVYHELVGGAVSAGAVAAGSCYADSYQGGGDPDPHKHGGEAQCGLRAWCNLHPD